MKFKDLAREGAKVAKGLLFMLVLFALALAFAPEVQAQEYETKQFPTFTSTTLVANGIVTNQQSYAVRNSGSIFNPAGLTNEATALRIAPGYAVGITISYTAATANNSNVVVGFAPSADGTNYTDAVGDMLLVTVPGSGGAHTNRAFHTNFSAAVLGGARFLSMRHIQSINAVAASGFKAVASVPKRN